MSLLKQKCISTPAFQCAAAERASYSKNVSAHLPFNVLLLSFLKQKWFSTPAFQCALLSELPKAKMYQYTCVSMCCCCAS
jgi:hypothetical protein